MDQIPSIAPVLSPRRRRRPSVCLRLTLRVLRVLSVALFVFLKFAERAVREPLTWLLVGAAFFAQSAYVHWPH